MDPIRFPSVYLVTTFKICSLPSSVVAFARFLCGRCVPHVLSIRFINKRTVRCLKNSFYIHIFRIIEINSELTLIEL